MALRTETIGAARLLLGDCREIAAALPRPAAVISDPPYGMSHDTDSRRFTRGKGRRWGEVVGDDAEFDPRPWLAAADTVLLWGLNHFPRHLPPGAGLVWLKRHDAAFGSFLSDGEMAWLNKGRGVYAFRDFSGNAEAASGQRVHPTQKPVALMRWCIQRAKVPAGGAILDPYMGSGSTGVAAVQMGHPFVGVEIEERYFDAACARIDRAQRQSDMFVPRPALTAPADCPVQAMGE